MGNRELFIIPIDVVPENLDKMDIDAFAKEWTKYPGVIKIDVSDRGEEEGIHS